MLRESKDGPSLSQIRMISRELKKIRVKMGAITADNVVLVARDPTHPLHRFFEWDDTKAADRYRHSQAVQLIARVTVPVSIGGQERPVRAFLGVDIDATRQYLPAAEVLTDAEMRAQVLAEMRNDLEAMRRRYESYEFCTTTVTALRKAIDILEEPTGFC